MPNSTSRHWLLSIAVTILKFEKITYYHKISEIYGVSRAAPHVRQYETIDLFKKGETFKL